ncbi:MAG: ABC transporter substrate-binding protein [Deltaproteobacteria bacterium]|nr:ABC transporter substrate-binding protein [Deltaproteobacteria bacterium]
MDKIHFPYRSESHLPFLHVVGESGSWEKHGLQVEYDYHISSRDAHQNVADGSVEFVGGNHISTYAKRAEGDSWVYLGQTVSILNHCLAVKPESTIFRVSDLRGKVLATHGEHPGLNDWLVIRQNGLDGEVEMQRFKRETPHWKAVCDGKADAAFVNAPADLFAKRAGLRLIEVDPLPMVWFTTVSTNLPFVEKHPDIVDKFLRGLIEGIAYFKTNRAEAIRIIQAKYRHRGEALDQEAVAHVYDDLAKILMPKPYASMQAISNVYELAKKLNKDAEKVEPMSLWDFHFVRRIDDSGFIDDLYKL